mmetsp:Transcript_43266/g.115733  ORF Transcript_43266/g.115733 Transcript_43266/m.115733 type:complete len:153 (-) Transcript_43266:399-857(-)
MRKSNIQCATQQHSFLGGDQPTAGVAFAQQEMEGEISKSCRHWSTVMELKPVRHSGHEGASDRIRKQMVSTMHLRQKQRWPQGTSFMSGARSMQRMHASSRVVLSSALTGGDAGCRTSHISSASGLTGTACRVARSGGSCSRFSVFHETGRN